MGDHSEELIRRIVIDPAICHGKPCVRGLRYPVELLLELLSAGMTPAEILADYPDLEQRTSWRRWLLLLVSAKSSEFTPLRHENSG